MPSVLSNAFIVSLVQHHCSDLCFSHGIPFFFLQKHFILSVLLEAGGCSSKAFGNPEPDCIYVDQVKATILQLDGIDLSIDERLEMPSAPLLSCVDWFLPSSSRDKLESMANWPRLNKQQNTSNTVTSPSSKKMLFGESTLRMHKPSPLKSRGGSDSGTDGPEGRSGNFNPYLSQSKGPGGFDRSNSLFKVILI